MPDWVIAASNLSGPAMLVIALWAGLTRKWVWGHHYEELNGRLVEMRAERDEYKDIALRAIRATEAVVGRKLPPGGDE